MSSDDSSLDPIEATQEDDQELRQLLAEERQKNGRLMEENLTLRSQYDEALQLAQTVTEHTKKNSQLEKELSEVKAGKDDIQRRLEISIKLNDDLTTQLEQEKSHASKSNSNELNDLQKIIEKEKKDRANAVSQLTSNLEQATQIIEESQQEIEQLKKTISDLIDSGQIYFSIKIRSAAQLRELMLNHHIPKQANEIIPHPTPSNDENDGKLAYYKQRYIDEKKSRKQAESKVSELEAHVKQQTAELTKEISNLENQIVSNQEQIRKGDFIQKQQNVENETEIRMLKNQIEQLERKLTSQKKHNQQLEEIQKRPNPLISEVNDLKDVIAVRENTIKSQNKSISSLKKQISTLISQLKSAESARTSLKKKLEELATQNDEQTQKIIELSTINSAFEIKLESLETKLKSTTAQLEAGKTSFQQSQAIVEEAETRSEKLRTSIALLEKTKEKQKSELSTIYSERERLFGLLQQQNIVLQEHETQYIKLIEEMKSVKNELERERNKPIQPTIIEHKPDVIPLTSWFCPDFPRDLTNLVSEVAKNDALPTTGKLKHIFSTIARFYNQQIDENCRKNKSQKDEFNRVCGIIDHFIITLCNLIGGVNLTLDDIISSPVRQNELLMIVTKMIDQISQLSSEKAKLEENILSLFDKLGTSEVHSAQDVIDKMKEQNDNLDMSLKKEKQKNKKHKKGIKETDEQINQLQRSTEDVIASKDSQIKSMKKEMSKLSNQLFDANSEIKKLNNRIVLMKQEQNDHISEIETEHESFLSQMKEEYGRQMNEITEENENRQNEINNLSRMNHKLEKEVNQWKNTAEMIKNSKKEKEHMARKLAEQLENCTQEWKEKFGKEKENLQTQYLVLIDHLKKKNKELRELVHKLTGATNDCEAHVKELNNIIMQHEMEKQQLSLRLESQKEEMVREKQLIDTKMKAMVLSTEMKCQSLIEESKSESELERRKLLSYVANQFRQFFDARQQLGVDCFKSLIQEVALEIDRLQQQESSIRRLLGISPSESAEDAVAKVLLQLYRPQ